MTIGRVTVMAAALLCGLPLLAQNDPGDSARAHPGPLTVWVVQPITAVDRAVRQAQKDLEDIKQYRESTAGEFGKPASETGQTAGSYGKPAGDEGRPASEVGQTAGSYGQTAGSLPSDVPSQTAGSYGQTAGSFGQPASSYTGAPSTLPTVSAAAQDAGRVRLTEFLSGFRDGTDRRIRVVDVPGLDLRERLKAAEGKEAFPDVLVADQMPTWWPSVVNQMTVRRLADLPPLQAFADEARPRRSTQSNPYAFAYALVQAPHPEAAREFLDWWGARSRFDPGAGRQRNALPHVESLAREAVSTMLGGGPIDAMADPAMARFNAPLTLSATLGFEDGFTPPDLKTEVAVTYSMANSRFAVVQLHAVCLSRLVYGELFPVVLLRADKSGEWRVLQVTLRTSALDAGLARHLLEPYARKSAEVQVSAPVAASPLDGDARAVGSGLRLAWDITQEDGLLLVEWQVGSQPRALASSIMLVNNQEGRAHAETTAPFANTGGLVRWRVWALGHGGVVQIGEWRSVQMR